MPTTAIARKSHVVTTSAPSPGAADRRTEVEPAAGQFYMGRRLDNRPESLATWRIATSHLAVGSGVAELLGTAPAPSAPGAIGAVDVQTRASEVRIVLAANSAVTADMRLWGQGRLTHHCDGIVHLSPASVSGELCGCPALMAERKALAKAGRGPHPSATVRFRLAQAPALGQFRFQSASWKFAESLPGVRAKLAAIEGAALCELAIRRVDVPVGGGSCLAYRIPVLTVLGPWG
ncbi:hypothetical protein ACIA8O_11920 [Kitasatospora sp. NPDC051853]|uniref:recombination directionality factor n=1 Tax=Kitasatospora sp. NPDC051853 TaxID=3364058 RepID=UPI003795A148